MGAITPFSSDLIMESPHPDGSQVTLKDVLLLLDAWVASPP